MFHPDSDYRVDTVHSVAGLGIQRNPQVADIVKGMQERRENRLGPDVRVVVVEEGGLLPAHIVDVLDAALRQTRGTPNAFGGLRIVYMGDFAQLPPQSASILGGYTQV